MDKSLAKRPRPPSEAEQVRATRDPGRTTRSVAVAPATAPTAAMLASPMGDSRLQTTGRQHQAGKANTPLGMPYGRDPSHPGPGRVALALTDPRLPRSTISDGNGGRRRWKGSGEREARLKLGMGQ